MSAFWSTSGTTEADVIQAALQLLFLYAALNKNMINVVVSRHGKVFSGRTNQWSEMDENECPIRSMANGNNLLL
jgi:hypothetical protein